jgi:flagellar basal-body rod modification protein FlgD
MNGQLQNRINPVTPRNSVDFSDAKVKADPKAPDTNAASRTSFKDLLLNSNEEIARQRAAQKNGDGLKAAKSDAEFAKMLADKLNRDNVRTPQNSLDKDAFLKLFVTQMQNQDPLNPDDSAEMAAQLAQFNGLEQMMNVNKNLEKMQAEQALGRAVGLTSFVGKEVKIAGNRAMLKAGHLSPIQVHTERDTPKAVMEVRNSAGVVIASRDLGQLKAGDTVLDWDGIDNQGVKSQDGLYSINVSAKDQNGMDVPMELTSIVVVKGVDLRESGGAFYTDIGPVKVSEISAVGDMGFSHKELRTKSQVSQEPEMSDIAETDQVGLLKGTKVLPLQEKTSDPTPGKEPLPAAPVAKEEPKPSSNAAPAIPKPRLTPPRISPTGEIIPS